MNKFFITTLLTLFSFLASAQSVLDSLENNLKRAKKEQQVTALFDLFEFHKNNDFKRAYQYANKALETCINLNDSANLPQAYSNLGYILTDLSEFEAAIDNYQKAIDLAEITNDTNILAASYNDMGYIFELQNLTEQAISFYLKSLKYFEKKHDSTSIAIVYNNIGLLYDKQGNHKTARDYYLKSLKIKEQIPSISEVSLAYSYNNLGASFLDSQEYNKAKLYLTKALKLRMNARDLPGIAQSYLNLSSVYRHLNEYETGLEYAQKAYDIYEILDDKKGLVNCYNHFSIIEKERGNNQKAISYLKKAEQLAKRIDYHTFLPEIYIGLARNYQILKKYKLANNYYEKYITILEQINNEELTNRINQLALKYQFDKKLKEKEVEQLQKDHLHRLELEKQRFLNYIIGISLILILIITLILYLAYKNKQKNNEIISHQKALVEQKSKELQNALTDITDSVRYAKHIQNAILPQKEQLQQLFPNIEVLFFPKDIVSGDFYWASQINDIKLLALADCTGHGVPGAFMSLLGFTSLNRIINEEKTTTPHLILNKLDQYITTTLHQSSHSNYLKDGMDISLITIHHNTLYFSGANNGIWIFRPQPENNYNLIELRPDKSPIGGYIYNNKTFHTHELPLQKNDLIILYTDGFADQFGGKKQKKLKSKYLKEFIRTHAHLTTTELQQKLTDLFFNWKGKLAQIDDVTLLLFKI